MTLLLHAQKHTNIFDRINFSQRVTHVWFKGGNRELRPKVCKTIRDYNTVTSQQVEF